MENKSQERKIVIMCFLLIIYMLIFAYKGLAQNPYKYEKDVHLHFWSGYVISSASGYIAVRLKKENKQLIALGTTLLIGTIKEVYDCRRDGLRWQTHTNTKDLFYTMDGAMCAVFTFVYFIK